MAEQEEFAAAGGKDGHALSQEEVDSEEEGSVHGYQPVAARRAPQIRGTRWVGTLNNPTDADKEFYIRGLSLQEVPWIIIGEEKGEGGTPHLQMAFVTAVRRSRAWVSKHVCRGWIQPMAKDATIEHNVAYCSKEGKWHERGIRPLEKGKAGGAALKRKWDEVKEDLKQGMTQLEMADKYTELVIKHGNGLRDVRNLYQGKLERKPLKVQWFWGETGAGKSFRAEEEAKIDGRPLYRQNGSQWWDAYDGEPLVIIDDISPKYDFKDLLKHLDVYNVLIPCKGAHLWLKAQKIWVTSSFNPTTIDLGGQLARRIEVVEMKKANRPDIRNMFELGAVNAGFNQRDLMVLSRLQGGESPYSASHFDDE